MLRITNLSRICKQEDLNKFSIEEIFNALLVSLHNLKKIFKQY